jgi:hypothetical protein
VTSQKNILKYLCSEKITHNAINEGCHIGFYGPNVDNLLHSSISLRKKGKCVGRIFYSHPGSR